MQISAVADAVAKEALDACLDLNLSPNSRVPFSFKKITLLSLVLFIISMIDKDKHRNWTCYGWISWIDFIISKTMYSEGLNFQSTRNVHNMTRVGLLLI